MDKFVIQGGEPLRGEVKASGAKNSALKLLIASLLCPGQHRFRNVPRLADIESTIKLLKSLGCNAYWEGNLLVTQIPEEVGVLAHYDLVRKMRASILVLGPLLTRMGKAQVSLPGGCAIGTRPIDMHLEALKLLGAEIDIDQGYVHARAKRLRGNRIMFDSVTVGGTENTILAAVLAEGTTVIENAAKEPEIVDLVRYLISLGAKISGVGTSTITVEGVTKLRPSPEVFSVMSDRIEIGTFLIAGAITLGEISILYQGHHHVDALILKLKESGFNIFEEPGRVSIKSPKRYQAVDVTTAPYPHFATDLQAQFMALMTQAEGTSVITETIFENRFMHVPELCRMGADITPKTRVAIVRGKPGCLRGAPVMATDLRASACLVLAGLAAQGETVVHRIYHLDRGYEAMESKLSVLGASIQRLKNEIGSPREP